MYPQVPISPSLRSRYNSINTGELDQFKENQNTGDTTSVSMSSYISTLGVHDSQRLGNFEGNNNEHSAIMNQLGASNVRPNSSNLTLNNRNNLEFSTAKKNTMDSFPNPQRNSMQRNIVDVHSNKSQDSTPEAMLTQHLKHTPNTGATSGSLQHHLSQSGDLPNNIKNHPFVDAMNAPHPHTQNITIPPPPKIQIPDPFSSNKTSDGEYSFFLNKKMQDNKERLELLNISHSRFPSIGSPSKESRPPVSQSGRSTLANKSSLNIDAGKSLAPRCDGIQESNSNKINSRSNPRLPPKAPSTSSNNSFRFPTSQLAQKNLLDQELQAHVKGMNLTSDDPAIEVKEVVRPPTAPSFPSNKVNTEYGSSGMDIGNKATAQYFDVFKGQGGFPFDTQKTPVKNQASNQSQNARPPTAPNLSKSVALPKVDLLISLMDKTVESKRKEFEKLNKLKSALSELGDFNKRLLEENTRLKSGNTGSNLQEKCVLGKESVNNLVELNNYHTPLSFASSPFILEGQDPDSQINSLKTIINKKNMRISELEKRLSSGEGNKGNSSFEDGICYSLLNKLKVREEMFCKSLEEVERDELGKALDIVGECVSILSERKKYKISSIANDIINQIEFNYKALSVTLDHLLERQTSTLESIKHENKFGAQLEDSKSKQGHLNSGGSEDQSSSCIEQLNPKKHSNTHSSVQDRTECISYQVSQNSEDSHAYNEGVLPDHLGTEDSIQNNGNPERNGSNLSAELETEKAVKDLMEDDTIITNENQVFETIKDVNSHGAQVLQGNQPNSGYQSDEINYMLRDGIEASGGEHTDVLQSGNMAENCSQIQNDQEHAVSGNTTQNLSQSNIQPETFQYYSNHYPFENHTTNSNFAMRNELEQAGSVPPPALAAYYEGGGLENSDLFEMSSSMNLGSYNEEYTYYQAPVNYSNI